MMNTNEIKQTVEMLEQYMGDTNWNDTAVEGDGYCLTAHWADGGQTRFSTMDHVKDWLDDRRRCDGISVNLDELRDAIVNEQLPAGLDMSNLPTYGGEPIDEIGVFSWDADRVLRQTEYGWEIEPRG